MTTLPASFLLLLDGRGGSTDRMSGRSNAPTAKADRWVANGAHEGVTEVTAQSIALQAF